MLKNYEINGTEEIGLVTPTPGHLLQITTSYTSQTEPTTFGYD